MRPCAYLDLTFIVFEEIFQLLVEQNFSRKKRQSRFRENPHHGFGKQIKVTTKELLKELGMLGLVEKIQERPRLIKCQSWKETQRISKGFPLSDRKLDKMTSEALAVCKILFVFAVLIDRKGNSCSIFFAFSTVNDSPVQNLRPQILHFYVFYKTIA